MAGNVAGGTRQSLKGVLQWVEEITIITDRQSPAGSSTRRLTEVGVPSSADPAAGHRSWLSKEMQCERMSLFATVALRSVE